MVSCECGGELTIIEENGRKVSVSCLECGLEFKRRFWDRPLLEIRRGNRVWLNPLLSDLWRMFKQKGVNFAVRFAPDSDYWFHWWTPTWHFGKGPYITIGFWRFRIYRGY
jgi:hypothetical protein